ncbi:MAG: hypothetical protein RLZZ422_2500 [Pseudomonadota bacterium]|jgi:hypothetical protein
MSARSRLVLIMGQHLARSMRGRSEGPPTLR